jgi:hypothetical protein
MQFAEMSSLTMSKHNVITKDCNINTKHIMLMNFALLTLLPISKTHFDRRLYQSSERVKRGMHCRAFVSGEFAIVLITCHPLA